MQTEEKYFDAKHTCNPALADLDTALALAFPVSLPAFPPAYKKQQSLHQTTKKILNQTKVKLDYKSLRSNNQHNFQKTQQIL